MQGTSSIDAGGRTQLPELWYEQTIGGGLRVKLGKSDASTEFAFPEHAAEFINSSMGFSPTILGLPYPDPSTGAVAFLNLTDWLYAGGGVVDDAAR